MLLGAILGWAILSPLSKHQRWAPGPVEDWNSGSKGWIVWISLAIMLADAIVSLTWLVLRPSISFLRHNGLDTLREIKERGISTYVSMLFATQNGQGRGQSRADSTSEEAYDAPHEHQIGFRTTVVGLLLTLGFCIFAIQYSFAGIIDVGLTILALMLAMLLSIMGVRALGETDINPVSGISKLTQLIFALLIPPGNPNAVTVNLIAGGISEAGALQAGDLLQDLKTGHLLGASPKAQFWGQLIGSAVGAVASAIIYKLYTATYSIPGGIFQVPTAYVWVFTARLVTGQGLPPHTAQFAIAAAAIWACLTVLRIYGNTRKAWWTSYIPGGIAVAVGMYNTPSFTLARTFGGLVVWYWTTIRKREGTPMIVLSSGLILGEGLLSIINLGLASGGVPHL
jgi:OPT family oligopeptide transporter